MLRAHEVVVFLARPEALLTDDGRAAARALLTDRERARLDHFRFDRDRDVALASRALERRALSACAPGIAPADWRFEADGSGRPQLIAPRATLAWNVANTVGLVVCAVTRAPRAIGVDVEPARADAPPEVVDSHFASAERAGLRALPIADQPRRFVELWTLKEAYLKARSLGLSAPLTEFAVDPIGPSLQPLAGDPTAWQLAQWWTPTHCLALCVEGPVTISSQEITEPRFDPR